MGSWGQSRRTVCTPHVPGYFFVVVSVRFLYCCKSQSSFLFLLYFAVCLTRGNANLALGLDPSSCDTMSLNRNFASHISLEQLLTCAQVTVPKHITAALLLWEISFSNYRWCFHILICIKEFWERKRICLAAEEQAARHEDNVSSGGAVPRAQRQTNWYPGNSA